MERRKSRDEVETAAATGAPTIHASADLLYGARNLQYGTAQFLSRIDGDPNHVLVTITEWSSAGSAGALSAVYRMDVRDGRTGRGISAPAREVDFLADHHGNVRFATGDDLSGNRVIYMRPAVGGDVFVDQPVLLDFDVARAR